jgi:hypothetical protein
LGSIVFQGCGASEYYPQQTRPPRYWTQCQVCSACSQAASNGGYWTCCYALPGDVFQGGPAYLCQLYVVVRRCGINCLASVSPIAA